MDHLQTESRNPVSAGLDEMTALQIVQVMNAEDAGIAPAIATQADTIARAIDIIADRFGAGGRLIYIGAGTSGRLGVLDASECPPTFQSPPEQVVGVIAGGPAALTRAIEGAEDEPTRAGADLSALRLNDRDVVVGIATSGRTPYVLGAMACARNLGAFTIGLACNPDSELEKAVDLMIAPVVGPEVLSGSTRLKAGTATKLVLNMLTTGAMVRIGKTYDNLMVDLKATNTKLRARANRIVRLRTGLESGAADSLLQACQGEVKTALVVHQAQVSPEVARQRLNEAGGRVRRAAQLGAAPPVAPNHPDLVIGIDGGGSHTQVLIAERKASGAILGKGTAGPSNIQAVGEERATRALDSAVAAAFAQAGRPRGTVAAAALGLAGVDHAEAARVIRTWCERTGLANRLDVSNDATILLAGGTPAGWGLAVICGTGSIAFGRTADGRFDRSGGWGYTLGDEGSAYALALAGVRAVARAADGCAPTTALTGTILPAMRLTEPLEMIHAIYRGGWDRARLATLASLVLAAAEDQNDAVAQRIVETEATELARTAAAAARKLGLPTDALPLALTGGAILHGQRYRQRFLDALAALGVHANPVTLVPEPAEGAVRVARRLAGVL